ncbi:MAG: hypothetical protein KGJ90_07140 [Patescibacteria group bacterium]|nr:hypothetical protein [Patescibacteria group bacterium]
MKWCVWRHSTAPSGYITRLHIIKTPWFAICVHHLHSFDHEPDMHDHPVSFLSIILRGDYIEVLPDGQYNRYHNRRWLNLIMATDRHRIIWVNAKTTTLCFMGPKVRKWGYHTPDGWIYWKDYNKMYYQ